MAAIHRTNVPSPQQVFDDPGTHWGFLTHPSDSEFEGQHFDRKEACRADPAGTVNNNHVRGLIDEIIGCVSAFANSNREGGVLVLGIASNGAVKGINHLSEQQRNALTNLSNVLVNHDTELKYIDCTDEGRSQNRIILIRVSYAPRAICETQGQNPRAWTRNGSQNVPLTQEGRDRLRQTKLITDFERTLCCEYSPAELDGDLVANFRRVFLPDGVRKLSDDELLYEAGAVIRTDKGLAFTNAGLLFFAANPQRILQSAYIRVLRFSSKVGDSNRGLPTLDKAFSGPITKQIRDTRTFFRESAFFKLYQKRKSDGGFEEEPEYPPIATDEAIVNAVAHRDYAVGNPILCEAYTDAFVVRNPGRITQRDIDLPSEFTLADQVLDSAPRNPKLIEWLRMMRDGQGKAYVQALSEGTKKMNAEMARLGLPAPAYKLTEATTVLTLRNNSEQREAALVGAATKNTEFTNLYPLLPHRGGHPLPQPELKIRYKEFLTALRDLLRSCGWYIDKFDFGRIVAHRRGSAIETSAPVSEILKMFPAYELRVYECAGAHYLSIDHAVQVHNVLMADRLLKYATPADLVGVRCTAKKGDWREGKIESVDPEWITVRWFDTKVQEKVPSSNVIPNCSLRLIEHVLRQAGLPFDLHQTIKRYSLASEKAASRLRAEKIQSFADYAAASVFPVAFGDMEVRLKASAVELIEVGQLSGTVLPVARLAEPLVEFREQHSTPDVREGITKYGTYEARSRTVDIVPVCAQPHRVGMERLIDRLRTGKYKYRGAEKTFATRFTYSAVVTVDAEREIEQTVDRLLADHPEWIGEPSLGRIFLIHTPEQGYSSDDETSPYYVVKRKLLESGVPCQMVDTPTLVDPDWKDLNLALNVVAKCGQAPWVLPDAIPEADFFIGLSYTQSRERNRVMGFANVFNRYGRWEFYSGNVATFQYEERTKHFAKLVQSTMERLKLSQTPNIIFHYSARFSRDDRAAILAAARSVRPGGTFTFVSLNPDHNVRLFDRRPECDGSLRRGSYVRVSPHRLFLSTTGYNPFRRAMGSPKPLQLAVWVERPANVPQAPPDLKSIAVQVLGLTKLNWASTDAFCGEPITTKYAGDIAYLTAAFLRQREPFKLHPVLERTPWFL